MAAPASGSLGPRALMAGVPEGWRGRPNGSSLQESDASFHLATLQNSR